MGRDSTVTYQDVAIAANKIHATGIKVTARSVRGEVGRGSMVTILMHFKQWQQDQLPIDLVDDDNLMDPIITRAINLLVATKVQEATESLSNQLSEEQSSCAELIKEYTTQESEMAFKNSAFKEMETKYAELTGRAEQLEDEINRLAIALSNERKASEITRTELAIANKVLEGLPRLEAELEKTRTELLYAQTQVAINSEAAAVAKAKYESEVDRRKAA